MFGLKFRTNGRAPRDKVYRLRRIGLFASCTEQELELFARHLDEGTYPAGEVIHREGRIPTSFNLILEGDVELLLAGRHVGELRPGDCSDYRAMRTLTPAQYTARALTDVRVMVASHEQFRALSAQPSLEAALVPGSVPRPARSRTQLNNEPA